MYILQKFTRAAEIGISESGIRVTAHTRFSDAAALEWESQSPGNSKGIFDFFGTV